jgi:hypothetical protein
VPVFLQALPEQFSHPGFVLDYQNAQTTW